MSGLGWRHVCNCCHNRETAPIWVEALEPRPPAVGEVLCRTLELGVCGTDREILLSAKPWLPEGEDKLILGHESLARIEAVGSGVADFQPGDLVVPVVRRRVSGSIAPGGLATFRGVCGAWDCARHAVFAAVVDRSTGIPVSRARRHC